MGDLNVKIVSSKAQMNSFTKYLLKDVQALENMLEGGWFNETPPYWSRTGDMPTGYPLQTSSGVYGIVETPF